MDRARTKWFVDALRTIKESVQTAVVELRDDQNPSASACTMRWVASDLEELSEGLEPPARDERGHKEIISMTGHEAKIILSAILDLVRAGREHGSLTNVGDWVSETMAEHGLDVDAPSVSGKAPDNPSPEDG